MSIFKVDVYFRAASVTETQAEDFEPFKMRPVHNSSSLTFSPSEKAKQDVLFLDFGELVAVKVTGPREDDTA